MSSNTTEVHIDHFDTAAERAKALKTLNNIRSWGVECFPAELYKKKKERNLINPFPNSSLYCYYKCMDIFREIFFY